MESWVMVVTLIAVAVSFTVSASAGLGGSLILVPILALVLGTKEGVALAALLLAANNVVKVFAYRETLPFRKALLVIVLTAAGTALVALAAVPLMLVATFAGRRINRSIGERGYTSLFWGVMAGYTLRLALTL